jgi:hypothetical protein
MSATAAIAWGFGITLFLFLAIKWIFDGKKRTFTNFLIGDDNRYSVSRLQAVLWSFCITMFQVSAFVVTARYTGVPFILVFPTEVLMLLSLSLGSYVVVKGITVNRMVTNQKVVRQSEPGWSDMITGENGLDFSRFQMIIWTLFSIAVYSRSFYGYLDSMSTELLRLNGPTGISEFIKRFFDLATANSPIPNIDSTFLVLMGVSQGVYVGNKLIPTDKLGEVVAKQTGTLENEKSDLLAQIAALDAQLAVLKPATTQGIQQKMDFQSKRARAQLRLAQIDKEISSLKSIESAS